MRIVLVTSRVTFVKDNYSYLLKRLSDAFGNDIEGLCVIDNLDTNVIASALLILLAGARQTGMTILTNVIRALRPDREKLFKQVFYTKSINDAKTLETIRQMQPDLIINLRTRDIYKEEVLSIPTIGCINIHHGLLPDNRGTMCDLWALYEKRRPGFSIHYMNKKIDAGNILWAEEVDASGITAYPELPYRSSRVEATALTRLIHRFKKGETIKGKPNTGKAIRFTVNPTFPQIRQIKKTGLTL